MGVLDQGINAWVLVVLPDLRPRVGTGIVPKQQPCEVLGCVLATPYGLKGE